MKIKTRRGTLDYRIVAALAELSGIQIKIERVNDKKKPFWTYCVWYKTSGMQSGPANTEEAAVKRVVQLLRALDHNNRWRAVCDEHFKKLADRATHEAATLANKELGPLRFL